MAETPPELVLHPPSLPGTDGEGVGKAECSGSLGRLCRGQGWVAWTDRSFPRRGGCSLLPSRPAASLFPAAVRLDKLSEVAKVNTDAMRLAQEEISEYRRQLQAKTTELEALKGTQESLERQRQDSEERHHADVLSYQVPWRSGQRPRLGRDHPAAGEEQRWRFGFRDVSELWQMLGAVSEPAFLSPRGSGTRSLRWCLGRCVPQHP